MLKIDSRSQGNLGIPHLIVWIKRRKEYDFFFHGRKMNMKVYVYIYYLILYIYI